MCVHVCVCVCFSLKSSRDVSSFTIFLSLKVFKILLCINHYLCAEHRWFGEIAH